MKTKTYQIFPLFILIIFLSSIEGLSQSNPDFNDAEVAAIAVTANNIDIKYAEIAMKKSKNEEIRDFAKTMMNDHKAVIQQAVDLVTKLGVTPQENDLSKKLNKDAEEVRKNLNKKIGNSFDKAYINNEVAYHEAVINAIREVLIPTSENKELKDLLTGVLPAFEAHLEHAKMVQKKIGARK